MIEDTLYRTSSQYRYWSYTTSALDTLRQQTNQLASERVKAAVRRARAEGEADGVDVDTLTVEEELKIVRWGCGKIIEMGEAMTPRVPFNVVATAIQYLRRFYLTQSPLTYHPKQIITCALYLATKADHFHISLHKFCSALGDSVTEDDVKAPEFLLMQGLRFTLDVRHPMKGLDGGVGEMLGLVQDGVWAGENEDLVGKKGERRVGKAADGAKNLLREAAQMTDAYFLFTPAQIWVAAIMAVDEELARAFIARKLEAVGAEGTALKPRLLATIARCAVLLREYKSPDDDPGERKEIKRIGRKLHVCQNPEKLDIVAVARAKAAEKRDGSENSEGESKKAKKRKVERQRLAADGEVFGPSIKDVKPDEDTSWQ